jgi:hypothetical protein
VWRRRLLASCCCGWRRVVLLVFWCRVVLGAKAISGWAGVVVVDAVVGVVADGVVWLQQESRGRPAARFAACVAVSAVRTFGQQVLSWQVLARDHEQQQLRRGSGSGLPSIGWRWKTRRKSGAPPGMLRWADARAPEGWA